MLTRSAVVSAYQFILGRDPESETVIEAAISTFENQALLRASVLNSEEFASIIRRLIPVQRFSLGLESELPIQVECDGAELQRLLSRIGQTWEKLGAEEPYWSVLTGDVFKSDQFSENEEQFWASGKPEVDRLIAWLKRNGIAPSASWTCLEYGCGTGRVTSWLAQEFKSIIACDISSSHLALARQKLRITPSASVEFKRVSSLAELEQLPNTDLIFSVIVLQHNPPPIIAYILDKLLKSLRPAGVAYFQVPTFWRGYSFELAKYLDQSPSEEMEMHVLPQRYVFDIARRNNCDPIEVQPDHMVGSPDAISTTFLLRKRA
jgi:SAM-dependent methyltransferase